MVQPHAKWYECMLTNGSKKLLIAFFFCSLMVLICGKSMGITLVDESKSQTKYGRQVAALSGKSAGRKRSAENILVLVKTDGTDIDFSSSSAEICISGPGNRYTLLFSDSEIAEKETSLLNHNEHIVYAEKNQEVTACDTATEEEISFDSYGAGKMGFQPLLSWARKENKHVAVAIIDSGIGIHPLLNSRTVNGWDYVDNDDDPTNDEYGHGTHVAGIVADCTKGIDLSLYSIRILDANGKGTTSNAANAILEAAEKGTAVINLSFVLPGDSEALDDAVTSAVSAGCTVVVAAGNYGQNASMYCPAHMTTPGVIVVGAATEKDVRAGYSNYGSSVDCYAYGSGIKSCKPGGGTSTRSGTSQAAPHISAACALMKILYGGGPASIENRIKALINQDASVAIPQLDSTVPKLIPCHLASMILGVGESLILPIAAQPERSNQAVTWTVTDVSILQVNENGTVIALRSGQTELIRRCRNFDEISIPVIVTESPTGTLTLPASLTVLETEALYGVGGRYVIIGNQVNEIGDDALDGGPVILCTVGSQAAEIAEDRQWQYIAH